MHLMPRLLLLIGIPLLLAATGSAAADECEPGDAAYYGSSMTAWIDATARALENRAAEWNIRRVQIDVSPGPGIDPLKGERLFTRRLEARLVERGRIQIGGGGASARFSLSVEQGDFWALGSLEGEGIPGGGAVVVSCPRDRELATLMGARPTHLGQGRWTLRPLGTVRADVLDMLLLDLDRDGQDDIIILGRDGLLALRYEAGGGRPVALAGPVALPSRRHWPAIVTGWLAKGRSGRAAIATSAGHALQWGGGRLMERETEGKFIVPIRGLEPGDGSPPISPTHPDGPERTFPPALALKSGGPALSASHVIRGLASPLRALSPIKDRPGAWVFVRESGELGLLGWDEALSSLPLGPVGDDLLVVDLDGDGSPELVTTGASGPGEPDSLSIHRLQPGLSSGILFTEGFEGSVLAIAAGDLDFDGLPDLLIAEELSPGRAQLWHLERSR
jgi:hypothetical protein